MAHPPTIGEGGGKSEFRREISVDLEADANLNEDWGGPSHGHFLALHRVPNTGRRRPAA
jgi:hypothetical protein